MPDIKLEDSASPVEAQEPSIEWVSMGVAVPKDMAPRIKALAKRRGLNTSSLGRTLFMAALDADQKAA